MKLNPRSSIACTLATVTTFGLLGNIEAANAANIQLIGLTANNTLVSFDSKNPNQSRNVTVTGIDGMLSVIDFRPGDGKLYGLTNTNKIYTIDPNTGEAMLKSTLNMGINAGVGIGGDFNPNPDRLRLVGSNNQNFRVDVDMGTVTVDTTPLQYAMGDVNEGQTANITAAAYTNSFAPSPDTNRRTTLYEIDSTLDILVTQGTIDFLATDPPPADSPNNGQLRTIGNLGVDLGATVGFDIFSPSMGMNLAFAASGSTLYSIDLNNGSATTIGTIGNGSASIIGLASQSVPEPGMVGALIGFASVSFAAYSRRLVN